MKHGYEDAIKANIRDASVLLIVTFIGVSKETNLIELSQAPNIKEAFYDGCLD